MFLFMGHAAQWICFIIHWDCITFVICHELLFLEYLLSICDFLYHIWQMLVIPNTMGRWLGLYVLLFVDSNMLFLIKYDDILISKDIIHIIIMSERILCDIDYVLVWAINTCILALNTSRMNQTPMPNEVWNAYQFKEHNQIDTYQPTFNSILLCSFCKWEIIMCNTWLNSWCDELKFI